MKPICLASQRRRYWFSVALLCAGAGFIAWQQSRHVRSMPQSVTPAATTISVRRAAAIDPRDLVADWQVAGQAADSASSGRAITLSSPSSPQRADAFRRLIAGLSHENAASLFTLLHEADDPPRDEEWQAFLEKWGRMDGARAAAALEGHADGGRWIPGLLRAWASVDPESAVAWLDAPGQLEVRAAWRAAAERDLILGWLKADPDGAAAWLNTHRGNPGHAAATASFAKEVAKFDPENASEWANSIEGPWRLWAQEAVADPASSSGDEGYDILAAPHGDPASLPGIHLSQPE